MQQKIPVNIGKFDMVVRIMLSIGLSFVYLNEYFTSPWDLIGLICAGVLMVTALVGFSPIYYMVGIKSI